MIDVPQQDNAITSYKEGDTIDLSQFLTHNFKGSRNMYARHAGSTT